MIFRGFGKQKTPLNPAGHLVKGLDFLEHLGEKNLTGQANLS
jgi:hypothetical protein